MRRRRFSASWIFHGQWLRCPFSRKHAIYNRPYMATRRADSIAAHPKFEPVIGLEVHVQLLTGDEDFLLVLDTIWRAAELRMSARSAWVCPARCRC